MSLLHHDAHLEVKSISDAGVFTGYGSVYNVVDQGDDVVATGALTASLSEWKKKGALPAMLWQHKASEPIGSYTSMTEDSKGLFVEGQLLVKQNVPEADKAYALLKAKAVSGLSIGFITRESSMDQKTWIRTIQKADLWEVSLVTFPQNDNARVDSVKSIPKFESPSQLERYLRDVCSLTKTDARAIVSEAKTMFRRDAADGEISQAILDALKASYK